MQIRLGKKRECDYNESSDKDIEEVSLSYEQNKSIVLDAKEQHSTYGVEHKTKGKMNTKLVNISLVARDTNDSCLFTLHI